MSSDIVMELAGALLRVWHKHWNLPLSDRLEDVSQEYGSDTEAAAMVFAGWFAGLVIVFAGWFAGVVFNRIAGAVVFALAAWVLLLFRDRGMGDCMISARIARMLPGDFVQFPVIVPLVMTVIKISLLTAMFCCGGEAVFPLVSGGCVALEAFLLMNAGFSPPVVRNSAAGSRRLWICVIVLALISFLCTGTATAMAALIFALLWHFSGSRLHKYGMTAGDIRYWSALCGWFMLLAGVFAI